MNLPPSSPVDNTYHHIPRDSRIDSSPIRTPSSQTRTTTIHSPKTLSSSSSIASSSSLKSLSGPSNVLENLNNTQQQRRRNQLYKPFSSSSSPMEMTNYSGYPPPNHQYHLISPIRQHQHHHLRTNMRNKHNKLKFIRDQYMQDKLELQRDKYNELQFRDDLHREYEQEFNQLNEGIDLETLLKEEEEELKAAVVGVSGVSVSGGDIEMIDGNGASSQTTVLMQSGFEDEDYEAYIADYENDLEDFEIQQDLEIVEMLKEMDLSNNH